MLEIARAAKGFMPDAEGVALHDAGVAGGAALRQGLVRPCNR